MLILRERCKRSVIIDRVRFAIRLLGGCSLSRLIEIIECMHGIMNYFWFDDFLLVYDTRGGCIIYFDINDAISKN